MILKVNLIPYREARRLRKVQALLVGWGLTALVGLIAIFVASSMIADQISAQKADIRKNKQVIVGLDAQLGEIKDINSRKKLVEARLAIIETLSLQKDLPVQLLEDISKAIPENVWLREITTSGVTLKIVGNTLSNAMVADFMRQLDASSRVTKVNLTSINRLKAKKAENQKLREFKLSATIVMPALPEQDKREKNGKSGKAGRGK